MADPRPVRPTKCPCDSNTSIGLRADLRFSTPTQMTVTPRRLSPAEPSPAADCALNSAGCFEASQTACLYNQPMKCVWEAHAELYRHPGRSATASRQWAPRAWPHLTSREGSIIVEPFDKSWRTKRCQRRRILESRQL